MSIGFWQIVIIAGIVVLLVGRGKISELMGDVAKGIKSFKKGMSEEEEQAAQTPPPPRQISEARPPEPTVLNPSAGEGAAEPSPAEREPTPGADRRDA